MASVSLRHVTAMPEPTIEFAARVCYDSLDRREEGSSENLIKRLISSGHLSPLEHASATFQISGCSRAMTHQLVRHRLASYSQRSQRYVNEDQFEYVIPPALYDNPEWESEYMVDMETIQAMYKKWLDRGLRKEDARFVLPNACTTTIVMTANFREWRHILSLRTSKHAQWEIRDVCTTILNILKHLAPTCFEDIGEADVC